MTRRGVTKLVGLGVTVGLLVAGGCEMATGPGGAPYGGPDPSTAAPADPAGAWGPPGSELWILETPATSSGHRPPLARGGAASRSRFERFSFEEGEEGNRFVDLPREQLDSHTTQRVLQGDLAREGLPGGGQLRARLPDADKTVVLPLKHTDVQAQVALYVSSVQVRQEYHNPYDVKIEAVYVFPLPQNAAVRDFIMKVGDRTIRGIIREREEARRIYEEARSQGYVASLLTQERPNIFTQSVANIEPGKSIDIDITYFHTLPFSEGEYELVFPMVVGPRYNPAGSTDGIGAVAKGQRGLSGQPTEVEYLTPGTISSHDVSLKVDIDAGSPIHAIESPSHAIDVEHDGGPHAIVRLSAGDGIPNRDFVLRYRVGSSRIQAALATHVDDSGGYFTLVVHPPDDLREVPAPPREMVFVIDCSGSMSGEPIARAKAVLQSSLQRLRPEDTFQVIRFSNSASTFGPEPIPATPENVARAVAYVEGLHGQGGTEMIQGVCAALDFPHDPGRYRIVAFLTDGYIGNDRQILGEVQRRVGASRIFSFGVGSSVNRYLLEGMARLGRGAVAYAGLAESREDDLRAVDAFFQKVEHPAMTDIQIDWGGLGVREVYPDSLPDLFVGRPVILTGRFAAGATRTDVRIHGRVGGESREIIIEADPAGGFRHDALASVWARAKIADLYARVFSSPHGFELESAVKEVALQYGILSAYTAFVAVDSLTRTEGDHGISVRVPVNVPKGVRYETTVSE